MAVIFLARQPKLDREVALKRLEVRGQGSDWAERFLREAKVAGSFGHPNIVTVHDFFEHDGQAYIAMEYVKRGSLRAYLDRGLTQAQIFGVLEGVLDGLAHAGGQGVVHRDMKPENVLVTSRGGVKIADFGIAKAYTKVTLATPLTDTGMALGTPYYMAPEQALAKAVGPSTDLYAVGAMTYEMVAGSSPFEVEGAPMAILLRHINEPPPPLPAGTDPRFAEWIMWLLGKEPASRPASADEAWERLEEIAVDRLGSYWRRSAALLDPGEVGPLRRTPTPLPTGSRPEATTEPEAVPDAPVVDQLPEPKVESPTNGDDNYKSFVLPTPPERTPLPETEPDLVLEPEVEPEPDPRIASEPGPDVEPEAGPQPEPEPEAGPPTERDPVVRFEPDPETHRLARTVAPRRPVTAPAPAAPERERRGLPVNAAIVVGAGVAAVAAALLAYSAAPAKVTRAPEPVVTTVPGSKLAVRVPAGWRSGPLTGEAAPGLKLRDAVALRPPNAAAQRRGARRLVRCDGSGPDRGLDARSARPSGSPARAARRGAGIRLRPGGGVRDELHGLRRADGRGRRVRRVPQRRRGRGLALVRCDRPQPRARRRHGRRATAAGRVRARGERRHRPDAQRRAGRRTRSRAGAPRDLAGSRAPQARRRVRERREVVRGPGRGAVRGAAGQSGGRVPRATAARDARARRCRVRAALEALPRGAGNGTAAARGPARPARHARRDRPAGGRMSVQRRRLVIAALAAVVLFAGAAYALGRAIKRSSEPLPSSTPVSIVSEQGRDQRHRQWARRPRADHADADEDAEAAQDDDDRTDDDRTDHDRTDHDDDRPDDDRSDDDRSDDDRSDHDEHHRAAEDHHRVQGNGQPDDGQLHDDRLSPWSGRGSAKAFSASRSSSAWSLSSRPPSSGFPGADRVARTARPLVVLAALDQDWRLFAPEPPRASLRFDAVTHMVRRREHDLADPRARAVARRLLGLPLAQVDRERELG